MTGTVGTLAQRQCAAALSSAKKDASTEGGDLGGSVFSHFLLCALPVLKAIKEQISSQRERR